MSAAFWKQWMHSVEPSALKISKSKTNQLKFLKYLAK